MTGIDIVIPTAGRPLDLHSLLQSLHDHASASLAASVSTITVTDDRPDPERHVQLKNAWLDLLPMLNCIPGPARGPAANRNHGAAQGRAPWLLFLDDDCLLTTNLISAYARAMERWPEVAVLEGAIAAVGPRPSGLHHAPLNGSGGYLWSCNFMIRRELFEQLGGFDERFPFAALEDCELMERLGTDGQVVRFVADATVAHPWRQGRAIDIWRQFVSHALLADKHPAFVRRWSPVNLLRMLWGRVWLYRGGRFRTIGVAQWPLVALDLASPLLHCAAVRLPVLRRGLVRQAARSRTAARSSGSEPHHSGQHPA